jgi:hypothetical protein
MKKHVLLLGALGTLLISGAVVAGSAKAPPKKMVIDACQKKKPPTPFDHEAHGKLTACDTCHHTQKGLKAGSNTEVKKCAACHKEPEKADTPKCTEMSSKKNPYHIRCTGCHKEVAKKDPSKKAIKKCDTCHPKK